MEKAGTASGTCSSTADFRVFWDMWEQSIGGQDSRPADLHLYRVDEDGTSTAIQLERADQEKDLGITIDNELTFKNHIQQITRKANSVMGIIRRGFDHLDKDTFLPLYTHLVRSHLEFGQSIWNPRWKGDVRMLESVQKCATKQVIGLKKLPYLQRLQLLGLPTLAFRRARGDMIETYKIMHNKYDEEVSLHIPPAPLPLRGHDFKVFKQRALRLDLRRSFFSLRIAENWNGLPESVVTATTLNQFKNRLDKFWENHPAKYDIEQSWG